MALTPEQIERTREVALLKKYSEAESLVLALNATQEARLIELVETEWDAVRFKTGHVVPNRRDILSSKIEKRRLIVHTVRMMLGLDPVSDAEISMAMLDGTYGSTVGGKGGGSGSAVAEFGVFSVSGIGNRNNSSGGELG